MSSTENNDNTPVESNSQVNGTDSFDWKKEQEKLISKVGSFEKQLAQTTARLSTLDNELKARTQERDDLKKQVKELQELLSEAKKNNQKNATDNTMVETMKQKSEEMLTKAKEIIFEKVKVCKNQELQIEALNQQVASLKEVVRITKDLLEIRNIETKHLQDKIEGMESKFTSEKERHNLIQTKLERMVSMNAELKREYETQLCLFSALRERYNERELARNVLSDIANNTSGSTGSASTNPPDNPPN